MFQFVQASEEFEDANKELYAFLWELRSRPHDVVLNGLPDMPRSPHELIQALKDTGVFAAAPFGRLPTGAQDKPSFLRHAFNFVRMLLRLEFPKLLFADFPHPSQHAELIDKVVQRIVVVWLMPELGSLL